MLYNCCFFPAETAENPALMYTKITICKLIQVISIIITQSGKLVKNSASFLTSFLKLRVYFKYFSCSIIRISHNHQKANP